MTNAEKISRLALRIEHLEQFANNPDKAATSDDPLAMQAAIDWPNLKSALIQQMRQLEAADRQARWRKRWLADQHERRESYHRRDQQNR